MDENKTEIEKTPDELLTELIESNKEKEHRIQALENTIAERNNLIKRYCLTPAGDNVPVAELAEDNDSEEAIIAAGSKAVLEILKKMRS